jgi:hypothetical protein
MIKHTGLARLEQRNVIKYNKKFDIQQNGEDNLYPDRMLRIIDNSYTAKACVGIINKFITGGGFNIPDELLPLTVGKQGITTLTINKLLRRASRDVAYHNGLFIHVNYNLNYRVSSVSVLPYEDCRLGLIDDYGNVNKIQYADWSDPKLKPELIIHFDVFNPDPEVIKKQMKLQGGAKKYRGQVLYYNFDEYNIYPLSVVDVVREDADTEGQIQKYKNLDLRSGFFAKYIIRTSIFDNDDDRNQFIMNLKRFTSAENNTAFMHIEEEFNNDPNLESFKIEKIEQNIDDKIWEHYETSIANNIRKSIGNIPPVLIDYVEGSLGNTSGESMVQAIRFMNKQTENQRLIISELFFQVFQYYADQRFNNPDYYKIIEL